MNLNEIESYFKERLKEKYSNIDDDFESIVYHKIIRAMMEEFFKNEKYENYNNKERLYSDILPIIEPLYVTKKSTGETIFHTPESRYVPNEKYKKPNKMQYATDIISNSIFYEKNNCKGTISKKFNVAKKESEKIINVICEIDYSKLSENNKKELEGLTVFDRAVLDVANTMWLYGNNYATYNNIYRVLCGDNKADLRKAPKVEQAISRAITKSRNTDITINNQAEADFFGVEGIYIKRHLLEAYETLVIDSGNPTKGIVFTDKPILLGYAESRKQIDSKFYVYMMNTPISKTVGNITLQNYLARRVIMILRGSISNKISCDTMCKELGIIENTKKMTSTQRTKRQRIIDTSMTILDDWTSKGLIEGYEPEGKRPIRNIVILKKSKKSDKKSIK